MIDESLLKSNFIGRDGFRWWIGQIPPTTQKKNGKEVDIWKGQVNGSGWGNRYKVRILGYHPYSEAELSNEDLPWAGVLLPVTAGSGAANIAESSKVRPGDVVIGFFLDGDNGQLPMIMGTFGRTSQVLSKEYVGPFIPFTGYNDNIKKPTGSIVPNEQNQQNALVQPSPRAVSQEQIDRLNQENSSNNRPENERTQSAAIGQTETFADTCDDNFLDQVTGILENLLAVIGEATDFLGDVQSTVRKIQNLTNNVVGQLFNSLYNELIPLLIKGLELLYDTVSAQYGHLAGVAAQKAMVIPVKELQDAMTCVASKIVEGLGNTIKDLVEKTIIEVVNFGVCAAEQFVSSLLNGIIDDIVSGLDSVLGGIDKILDPAFKVADFLRSSVNTIKSIGGLFDCGQNNSKCKKLVKKWTIGYGPEGSFDLEKSYENVLNNMNISAKIAGITTLTSPYTKPDCNVPTYCGSPTISFFGGDGFSAAGKAILGDFVNNVPEIGDVTSSITQTASIIGVEIKDPGYGYYNAPPLVSFSDPCNYGYGAIGRAIVDYNKKSKKYGQVVGVYMVSVGENYPVGNVDQSISSDIAIDNPTIVPYGVTQVIVLSQGSKYSTKDTATDNLGNTYKLTVDNGRIISAEPINIIKTTTLPEIVIDTDTGTGAILKPIIGRLPTVPQGQIEQVIDCIT